MADSELQSAIGNNEECVNLFSDCDNVFVVAGISPLIDFQNNLNRIENYLCQKKIVGVKLYPGMSNFILMTQGWKVSFYFAKPLMYRGCSHRLG